MKLMKELKAAMSRVARVSVSEWANANMVLPSTSAEPGRYKTGRTPYVTDVMNAFTEEKVHKVVVKSAAQAGKSTILLAVIGRYVELDPCAMMIVEPTLEMAQDFSKDRLERLILDCKVLTPLFSDLGKMRNTNQTILSKFFKGGRLVLQGANSPAGLASRPIRILLCDEVDRFPASAGAEGDPIALAEKRQTSYWNYKTGLFSTPTVEGVSRIDAEYELGTQEQWQHQCPNCGEYHFLDYREMAVDYTNKIDEYNRRNVIVNFVKWRCPDCGQEFTEVEMKGAEQKYVAQNPDAIKNGVRSFWINGFSSTFLSWSTIYREYLEAQGDPLREAVVFNTRFGISYKMKGEYSDENQFLNRREEILSEIPAEVKLLTAGVDVQANRLEVSVFGYGYGEQIYGVMHKVIRGSATEIGTWLELDAILEREYKSSNGALKIMRTFIDSGYNTRYVYDYCRQRQAQGVFAVKGSGRIGIPLIYRYTSVKNYGIILTILGVNDGKNQLFSYLAVEQVGSHYIHFYKDTANFERGFNEEYFKQLISEHRVARKSGGLVQLVWEKVGERVRNEPLDCFVYSLAAYKSCVGNDDADTFFRRLEGKVEVKKARQSTRSLDIY